MLLANVNQGLTASFIQFLMKKGKKNTAEVLIPELFKVLKKDYKKEPLLLVNQALENTKPLVGFRNVRLRGGSYKIPYFLKEQEQRKIVFCWFLRSAKRSKIGIAKSLAKCLFEASLKQGDLIKRRDSIHKLANQNKVFAHYRWF
jgi:small subunit ribosomal protein S7